MNQKFLKLKMLKTIKELFQCEHKWVLAIPESQVKIGGNVPYVCSKCGIKRIAKPKKGR